MKWSVLFHFIYDKLTVSGCGDLCAPITVCQAPDEWINDTSVPPAATACPAGRQFCPYTERCLPLASPCAPGACVNCSGVSPLPAGTQYPITDSPGRCWSPYRPDPHPASWWVWPNENLHLITTSLDFLWNLNTYLRVRISPKQSRTCLYQTFEVCFIL